MVGTRRFFVIVVALSGAFGPAELVRGQSRLDDCNTNGIRDACDISCAAPDCAGVPGCGTKSDCNFNRVPDQ
jgi:hypothetical protein